MKCEMIWKIWKKGKLKSEKIWKIWRKGMLNSEKIWKIQKKSKLNSEKIWKLWKKSKLNMEIEPDNSLIISDIFFIQHFQQVIAQNAVQWSSLPQDFLRALYYMKMAGKGQMMIRACS
jgi:hypothetical protein